MARRKDTYNGYKPPFTLSAKAVAMITDISAQMERLAIRMERSHKDESINVFACDTVN